MNDSTRHTHCSRFVKAALALLLAATGSARADIVQVVAGGGGSGGEGTTLIDTGNDTDNWIDTINAGATYYLSFDWTVTNSNGDNTSTGGFYGGLGLYNGSSERLLLGNGWSSIQYGGGQGGAFTDTGVNYQVNDTVTLVARLTTVNDGAGNDSWALWVNPEHSDEGSPQAIRADWTIDDISKFTNRAGDNPGAATLGTLTVATSWGDVVAVPEASAFLFGALACGAVAAGWRWRRGPAKA